VKSEREVRSHAVLQKPKRFGILTMPTVLRFGSMRFVMYFNDHEPPHVHVIFPDGEVVVILDEPTMSVRVRDVYGIVRAQDLHRIAAIVTEHFETLLDLWGEFHP
jgi:Domain of unknown function (DUF4160)